MPEIDYLTHIVFKLFENVAYPRSDPRRFRVELSISSGAGRQATPPHFPNYSSPSLPSLVLNDRVYLDDASNYLRQALLDHECPLAA